MSKKSCIVIVLLFGWLSTASGTTYYVDPVSGSMSNDGSAEHPWSTLQDVFSYNRIETRDKNGVIKNPGAPVKAGDTLLLRSGYHGDINQSVYFNDALITVAAEQGHTPGLRRLLFSSAKNWLFKGLTISTELSPSFAGNQMLVNIGSGSSNGYSSYITIEDCFIYSVLDTSGWSAADWVAKYSSGVNLDTGGTFLTARNNLIKNVDHGILVQSQYSLVSGNEIVNFGGDAIRATYHDQTVEYNLIRNCYDVDDNHDDGIQSYLANVGAGAVYRINLIGNIIINTDNPSQPLQGPLQGIGIFDGPHYDFVVKNNVVITNHWHGITLHNSQNARIVNNTVFNKWWYDGTSGFQTWIEVTSDTTAGGNLVRNNIAHDIRTSGDSSATADHNLTISQTDDAAQWFVDYANFNLHPSAPSSPQVDAGSSLLAPDEDIDGIRRPQGAAYDIGAYEYTIPPVGDFTGDCFVDLEDLQVLCEDWLVSDYDLAGALSVGLVSHYKFDGDTTDSAGTNHAAAVGGPGYAAGLHNQAIDLAGTGKYVNCGNDASFNISGAITLSALIKGTFDVSLGRIIEKGYNWMLCSGYGDNVAFYCLGFGILEGFATVNDNQWHHIAGVFDGSKMYLYVDGRLDAVKNASGSLNISASNVYIGGNTSQSFNGLVDDVLIYNRSLSKSEIEYLSVRTDINTDGTVNFGDFALLVDNWLQ